MNKKKELPGFWPDDFAYREFFEYLSRTPPLYITKIVCITIRIPTVKLKFPGKLFFLKSDPELLLHSSYSF